MTRDMHNLIAGVLIVVWMFVALCVCGKYFGDNEGPDPIWSFGDFAKNMASISPLIILGILFYRRGKGK